jgi:uncharacterized membrane protein
MVEDLHQAKRPVSALLAGPYGHPLHPVLVTVPIGAWVAATVFDVASHVADDPEPFSRGAWWLLVIGVVGALAAALVGFLDLLAIPTGTPASRTALVHMTLNLAVTGGYLGGWFWRRAAGIGPAAVPWGPLVLSLGSLLVLAASGFLGGKLAFRYGVRVADEATQEEGYRRTSAHRPTAGPGAAPPATAAETPSPPIARS